MKIRVDVDDIGGVERVCPDGILIEFKMIQVFFSLESYVFSVNLKTGVDVDDIGGVESVCPDGILIEFKMFQDK